MAAVLSGSIINILHYGFNHILLPPAADSVMSHAACAEPLGVTGTSLPFLNDERSAHLTLLSGRGICLGNSTVSTNSELKSHGSKCQPLRLFCAFNRGARQCPRLASATSV